VDRFGKANSAFHFDMENDYIHLASPIRPSTNIYSGTVSAWINVSESACGSADGDGYRGIVSKKGAFGLFLYNNTLAAYDWSTARRLDTDIAVNDGKWHQVAMTFESGKKGGTKLFVDGKCVLTSTFKVASQSEGIAVGCGANPDISQEFLGSIDDVKIYNGALSDDKILELFHEGGW